MVCNRYSIYNPTKCLPILLNTNGLNLDLIRVPDKFNHTLSLWRGITCIILHNTLITLYRLSKYKNNHRQNTKVILIVSKIDIIDVLPQKCLTRSQNTWSLKRISVNYMYICNCNWDVLYGNNSLSFHLHQDWLHNKEYIHKVAIMRRIFGLTMLFLCLLYAFAFHNMICLIWRK